MEIFQYIEDNNWDEVLRLLERDPSAASLSMMVNTGGQERERELPLHYALNHNATLRVLEALHQANPAAIKTTTSEGLLPLHLAACYNSDSDSNLETTKFILSCYPKAAAAKDINGSIPLHYAAYGHGSLKLFKVLIEAYKAGACEKNSDGETAVDIAFKHKNVIDGFANGTESEEPSLPQPPSKKIYRDPDIINFLLDAAWEVRGGIV